MKYKPFSIRTIDQVIDKHI